jgi:hypothetical protein
VEFERRRRIGLATAGTWGRWCLDFAGDGREGASHLRGAPCGCGDDRGTSVAEVSTFDAVVDAFQRNSDRGFGLRILFILDAVEDPVECDDDRRLGVRSSFIFDADRDPARCDDDR